MCTVVLFASVTREGLPEERIVEKRPKDAREQREPQTEGEAGAKVLRPERACPGA